MKKSQIPDVVVFKSKLMPGNWIKRPGSNKDRNLYCWIYEEGDSMPHVRKPLGRISALGPVPIFSGLAGRVDFSSGCPRKTQA